MEFEYPRISLDNISELRQYTSEIKTAFIFGKGPTFQSREKQSKNELYICVNDSINEINDCDILVINDFETFSKINSTKLEKLPYLLIPERPHMKNIAQKDKKWFEICTVIKDVFKGKYIVYHLHSSPKIDVKVLDLPSTCTGSNNALDLISIYFPYIKNVEFFGVGVMKEFSYHSSFHEKNKPNSVYNDKYINQIRKHIETTCSKHKINYKIN